MSIFIIGGTGFIGHRHISKETTIHKVAAGPTGRQADGATSRALD